LIKKWGSSNNKIKSGGGEFSHSILVIPAKLVPDSIRERESRNVLLAKLDARLRGHDGKTPLPDP
jgi:hypothetical protein